MNGATHHLQGNAVATGCQQDKEVIKNMFEGGKWMVALWANVTLSRWISHRNARVDRLLLAAAINQHTHRSSFLPGVMSITPIPG